MAEDEFIDIPQEFKELTIQLAGLWKKDNTWINRQYVLHRKFLIYDEHHGYCIESAIQDLKENIADGLKKREKYIQTALFF